MVLTLQREGIKSEIEKNEVEFGEVVDSKLEDSGMKKDKAEESDHFENSD